MEHVIIEAIQKRLEQLEMECLKNLILLKTFAPGDPIPLFSVEVLEEKAIEFLAKKKIRHEEERFLSIKEAMSVLNVSRTTLLKLRKQGKLTTYNQKRNVFLDFSEVKKLLKTYSEMKGKV